MIVRVVTWHSEQNEELYQPERQRWLAPRRWRSELVEELYQPGAPAMGG